MTALRNDQPDDVTSGADPAEGQWSQAEMLLAAIADELRFLRHDYITAHTEKKSRRNKAPQPISRPGVKPPKPKLNDVQAEWLFRHINGLPQEPGMRIALTRGRGGG